MKRIQNEPLIHCITNPISINQCANVVLAVGARPIMAEHPEEVAEITEMAKALLLNLGNITDVRMKSMMISAKVARGKQIPTVIDAVGIACSELRRNYIEDLLKVAKPSLVKGNYSEIKALYDYAYHASGVEAEASLGVEAVADMASKLAIQYQTMILASGAVDVVTDGNRTVLVSHGSPQLATITGTGCMQGAVCASYLAEEESLEAVITACNVMGISGERAETEKGPGSFLANLLDQIWEVSRNENI